MKTPRHPFARNQQGSGLIEVLVLILVMAVGMLAMGKMHTVLLRDGGTAANRAIATSLAQEKIDDLRAFKWIDTASSGGEGCGNGIFCFSEIGNDTGGTESAGGALAIPSGSITVGNTAFTRNWTSVDNTTFKLVTVTVSWTDQNGSAEVVLQSAIALDDASITALSADGSGGPSMPGPKVRYTPIGVPDVVPVGIDVGDGLKRETSKPLPDVSSKGFSVRTHFDSVNYKTENGQTIKTAEDEFATVNCVCEFTSSGPAYPAAYFAFKDKALQVKYPKTADENGGTAQTVSKPRGTAPSISGDSQDPLCTACCENHHDKKTDTGTAVFDPDRPSTDYNGSGNHKHYYFSDPNNPQAGLVAVDEEVAGSRYLEACRFLRVDGIFRLMQDWRQVDMTVMPKDNYLTDGSAALTAYQTYIGTVVTAQAKTDGGTTTTWNKSSLVTRDLSNVQPGLRQLMSRGIYVDRVYKWDAPQELDTDGYYGATGVLDKLANIPFNEVNLTLLSSWASSNTAVATVTNQNIQDISASTLDYYGTYSRGLVSVLNGNGGNADITAYTLPSNSGLTGGVTRANYAGAADYDASLAPSGTISYAGPIGMDRHDHRSVLRKSNYLNIARAGSATGGFEVSGFLSKGNSSGDLSKLNVSGIGNTGSISCTIGVSGPEKYFYTCNVASGDTATFTVTSTQTGALIDRTENGTGTITTCSVSDVTGSVSCGDFWVFGPTIEIRGTCTGNRCNNADLSLAATGSGSTCVKDRTSPYCTVPLTSGKWTGTITASGVKVDIKASGTPVCDTATSASLTLSNQGPRDIPAAFTMCANN